MCMSNSHCNRGEGTCHFCRFGFVRFVFLASSMLSSVRADNEISVHTTIPLSCVARWNTSSATMQHVAYEWTHGHKVTNWLYKEMPDPSCFMIEYDTVVKVPPGFAAYIPSNVMATHVQKQICASSNELTERLRFSKIVLLGGFTLKLQSSIDNEQQHAVFASTCDIALPWFAQPLRQLIHGHISNSILEYMHVVTDSLCK